MSDSSWGRERDLRARPSPAFGGDPEGGAEGGESEAVERVDQLFSQAVERQVAEQRNLNRLLEDVEQQMSQVRNRIDELQKQVAREAGPTLDRLGALDAGLRSLRESVSAQSVALRTELQETIEKLRDEQRERADLSTESLTELRDADGRVASQVHDLAQQLGAALERIDARQGSLSEDVAGLRSALVESTEVAEQSRSSVAPMLTRLPDELATLRRDLETALGAQLEGGVGALDEQVAGLRSGVEGQVSELRSGVEEQLAGLRSQLDERLSALRTEIDDAVGDNVRSRLVDTEGRLEAAFGRHLDTGLGALQSHVDESVGTGVGDQLGELKQAIEQDLGALRSRLDQVALELDRPTEALSKHIRGLRTELLDELEQMRAQSEGRSRLVIEASETVGDEVSRVLAQARAELDERVSAVVARVGDLEGQLTASVDERVRSLLERMLEFENGLGERLHLLLDRLVNVESTLTTSVDERVGGLTGRVDALARSLTTSVEASLRDQRDRVVEQLLTQQRQMQEVRDQLTERDGALEQLIDGRLAEHRSELQQLQLDQRAGLREQLETQSSQQAEQLAQAVEHFRATAQRLTAELSELEALSGQITQNRIHEAEQRELLRTQLTGDIGAQLTEGIDGVGARLDEELVRVRARLDDGFSGLRDRVDHLQAFQETSLAEAVARQDARLDAALVAMTERLEQVLTDQSSRTERTLQDVSQAAATSSEAFVGRVEGFEQHLTALAERLGVMEVNIGRQAGSLEAVASDVGSMNQDVTATFQKLQGELLGAQAQVLSEIRTSQDDAEVRLVRAREHLDRSAAQVESRAEVLEELLAEALDRVAQRLRTESDEANAELRVAASRLDTTFQHLRHLESSLVAYLEARDRRLEQDRAQVLHAVLDELTAGLSKREKRKYADNLENALAALPSPPEVPQPRAALADLLGDDFGAEPVVEEVDDPQIVPVPTRKRSSSASATASAPSAPADPEPVSPRPVKAKEPTPAPAQKETATATSSAKSTSKSTAKKAAKSTAKKAAKKTGKKTAKKPAAVPDADGHVCPECGFVAKSAGGLGSHRRSHG